MNLSNRLMRVVGYGAFACIVGTACQRYPFEAREPKRSEVQKTSVAVVTVRPTDILFVIDNSGTMEDERSLVADNVELFLDALTQSSTDFQIGVVTTDVECNLPSYNCSAGGSSPSCCALRGTVTCNDSDSDGDGVMDTTSCDGGRLRSASGQDRIFRRPSTAERAAWVVDFKAAISALNCDVTVSPREPQGSGFEAGLEAMTRAVGCSVGSYCPEPVVADLNAGFIRPGADLVVIFLTDEDDCSFDNAEAYRRPSAAEGYSTAYQESHLCSPEECYAQYAGLYDWWSHTSSRKPLCGELPRTVSPPGPTAVSSYLDKLIALKDGDVRRIRAAAIVSGIVDVEAELEFVDAACYTSGSGPSTICGCLSTADDTSNALFCKLTELLGQGSEAAGTTTPNLCGAPSAGRLGCTSMPGTRYTSFLRDLAARRTAAGVDADVLVDSICQPRYDDTLYKVVNNVIINNCFDISEIPASAGGISVSLNGSVLQNVAVGSGTRGWSWRTGSSEICLEGGLQKTVDDRFDIYVLSPEP